MTFHWCEKKKIQRLFPNSILGSGDKIRPTALEFALDVVYVDSRGVATAERSDNR